MKTLSLLLLILLISCGEPLRFEHPDVSNSFDSRVYWPDNKLPATIKVPVEKFEKFKEVFLEVEKNYEIAAGRPLIKFTDDKNKISLENFSESKNIKGSNFLMFKEDEQKFLDLIQPTLGITQVVWYIPSMQIYQAHIVIDFSKGEMKVDLFKEVLLHEISHFLGFGHVENEDSIMREILYYPLVGLRNFDIERIREKYLIPTENTALAHH